MHCTQVLLAWGLQHETSIIPKTTKVKNLEANLEVLKFKLPEEDYKSLCSISPQASLWHALSHALMYISGIIQSISFIAIQ